MFGKEHERTVKDMDPGKKLTVLGDINVWVGYI